MKYIAYKLTFQTGVHFGSGMLNETMNGFRADTLFSALCIEAGKFSADAREKLYNLAKDGKLLFSDGFPFIGETLYIPKPMVSIEGTDSDISIRKKWKKLTHIPMLAIEKYFEGTLDVNEEEVCLSNIGHKRIVQKVSLVNTEKSEPYSVGAYYFSDDNGLYFIVGYQDEQDIPFVENLIDSLGFQGIGGKVSAGFGKYSMLPVELPENIQNRLRTTEKSGKLLLLTTSLPKDEEMENVLADATYLIEKRSGFIQSANYAEELVKKQNQYFIKSGSMFSKSYAGDIYDVGGNGKHPVWRYAKPIFMEVSE